LEESQNIFTLLTAINCTETRIPLAPGRALRKDEKYRSEQICLFAGNAEDGLRQKY
jgi:hypothetical protein